MVKKKDIEEPKFEEASGEMMLEETSNTDVMLEEKASSTVMLEEKASKEPLLEESTKAEKPTSKKAAAPSKPTKANPKKTATGTTNSIPLSDPYTGMPIDELSEKLNEIQERLRSASTGNKTATTETPRQETHSNKQTKEEDDNLSNQNGWIAFIAGIASAVYLSFVFFSAMGGWGILLALVIGAFVCCGAAWMLMKHRRQWTKILCWSSFIIIWGGLLANFIVHENINLGTICGSFFTSLSAVGLLGLIVDHKELF